MTARARGVPARLRLPALRRAVSASLLLACAAGTAASRPADSGLPTAPNESTRLSGPRLSAPERFLAGRRDVVRRLAHRAGIDPPPADLPAYERFGDLVQKGLRTGSTRPVDPPDAAGVIRRVEALPCSARDGEAEAVWLLRAAWGADAAPVWSTGLAALEIPAAHPLSPDGLASALAAAGLLPSLEEVLDAPRAVAQYPTLFAPAAHRLVGWVIERHGAEGLRRAVFATRAPGGRVQALAGALGTSERDLRRAYTHGAAGAGGAHTSAPERESPGAGAPGAPEPTTRQRPPPAGFHKGVCYAHTVSLERGYASRRSARTLDRLRGLGADWISITPFGYIESGSPRIAASSGFGPDAETDEAMAEVIEQARRRGLGVMVKPHLWSRDFVGRLSMLTEEDWKRFFLSYGRYLAHHAILSEACGASALCVGNELAEATRGREREWRALIAAARALFSGPLTYGAHWDEEAGRVRFWDALDWVGVSFYAPLAAGPQEGPQAWRDAARRQIRRLALIARRAGKPLVLVEAGFPSHARAALAPWEDPESGPADAAAQAQAFEALAAAIREEPAVAGVYWWKWFTDDAPAPLDRSHRFAGKPAEEVVKRFFGNR